LTGTSMSMNRPPPLGLAHGFRAGPQRRWRHGRYPLGRPAVTGGWLAHCRGERGAASAPSSPQLGLAGAAREACVAGQPSRDARRSAGEDRSPRSDPCWCVAAP
jgi:hypothetical protein